MLPCLSRYWISHPFISYFRLPCILRLGNAIHADSLFRKFLKNLGLLNMVFKDLDGSFAGSRGQVVSANSLAIGGDERCIFKTSWNAYWCPGTTYDVLNFESKDSDRYSRRVNPVEVRAVVNGGNSTNVLNCYMDRRWDDDYTSLLRLSRFPAVVELGNQYNITFAGTNPRSLR